MSDYELIYNIPETTVIVEGVQGPPGPPGPSGAGASHSTYTFTQNSPSTTWNITHNLSCFPAVTVVDSGGTVVNGNIQYNDSNSLTLSFSAAFSGKAYLN